MTGLSAVFLTALLTLSGIEYKNYTDTVLLPVLTGRITGELEGKTGIRIRFIVDKNIEFSAKYFEAAVKGVNRDNEIIIFIDKSGNKYYKFQGKNTIALLSTENLKYIIENETARTDSMFFNENIDSLAAVLASAVSEKKGVPLKSLEGVYVKPVNSFLYRLTNTQPFRFVVKAFYYNKVLFISIFPICAWLVFVKAIEILFGAAAAEKGAKVWKVFLFATFCVIITRVFMDYNRLIGSIAGILVLFMPFVVMGTAVFKDEMRSFTFKFFGWEE